MKRILIGLLTVLLLLGCALKTPDEQATATEPVIEATPAAATDEPGTESVREKQFHFSTTDLDGNAVDESIFDGYDLVMLNFWAYWCGPCVREMPELEQLHQAYPNVLLLGVIVDESDMDETRAIIKNAGVTYPVLYPEGDLAKLAQNCQYIPTTFFLKPNGMLIDQPTVGSNDLAGWTRMVEGYLK